MLAAAGAAELLAEIVALQSTHFDPAADSYSQLLASRRRTIFNWGTGGEEGAVEVNLESSPHLARLTADALTLATALEGLEEAGDEEGPFLSIVPSIGKTRSFPRFYHRDSHTSVSEVDGEGATGEASSYSMVWDLGLANSSEVLDVDFVPRRALLDVDGRVRPEFRHLFQLQDLAFRAMSDAEIDAVQPQMREERLPFAGERPLGGPLRPGRAFVWLDDLFFHTTYLRRGREVAELAAAPRSILIVRGFAGAAWREIPWSPAVRRLLSC